MENFAKFIQCYGRFDGEYMGNDKYLALWKANKDKYLRKLLGGSLKLEKKISLDDSEFEKRRKSQKLMREFCQTHDENRCAIEYASKIIEAAGFENVTLKIYNDRFFDYIDYYDPSSDAEIDFGTTLHHLCAFLIGVQSVNDYQSIPHEWERTIEFPNGKKFQFQGKFV